MNDYVVYGKPFYTASGDRLFKCKLNLSPADVYNSEFHVHVDIYTKNTIFFNLITYWKLTGTRYIGRTDSGSLVYYFKGKRYYKVDILKRHLKDWIKEYDENITYSTTKLKIVKNLDL